MLLNVNTDPRDHSSCALSYEEEEGWLQATWRGYVDPAEAMRGAEAYLHHAAHRPCPFLFNDNSLLRGPWFDSLDWLTHVWAPHAISLGLRYVAHVVQTDRHFDVLSSQLPPPSSFELQIFQDVDDARLWLRQVRDVHLAQVGRSSLALR